MLAAEQYNRIVDQAWNASQNTGSGSGGGGGDGDEAASRKAEAGQSGGQLAQGGQGNTQAYRFGLHFLKGLQAYDCTLGDALQAAQSQQGQGATT